jgi:hypothetical protein
VAVSYVFMFFTHSLTQFELLTSKDLENIEVQRMNKTRDLFNKLVRINEPLGPECQAAIQRMKVLSLSHFFIQLI